MTLITCKVCQLEVRRKVRGQRFCTAKCRQAHFRQRTAKKRSDGVTHKSRLYPPTGTRYENAEKTNENWENLSPQHTISTTSATAPGTSLPAM